MPELVHAEGVVYERILDLTYPLWNDGLTRARYGQYNHAQLRTPWGAQHLARLALVERGELLATAKQYDLRVAVDGRTVDAVGIGAVFTPPDRRGQGHGRAVVEAVIARAARQGAKLALLFSEIGTPYYERLGFVTVPLQARALAVRELPGAPAVPMRAGEERDLSVIADIHAKRAGGYRLALCYDAAWLRYVMAKRRLLAGLGEPQTRHFEFFVTEEGGRAVAWVMLQVERAAADPAGRRVERWTVESCGDRDPSGARVGAMLQALLARTPAAPPDSLTSWWPDGFEPPQIDTRPLGASAIVMMMRPLTAAPAPPLGRGDVLYWHVDAF